MGLSPNALYDAISDDLKVYDHFGPVGLGSTPPDASYKQVASSLLLHTLLKKYIVSSEVADFVSKEKFLASNKKCRDWSYAPEFEYDHVLFGEFRRELDRFFNPGGNMLCDSFCQILDEARCGPGAAVLANGNSLYAKLFSSKLSVTSQDLYLMYSSYIHAYPTFFEAECLRQKEFGDAVIVNGSKTSFVPKTVTESRMICIEPILNMYFQLGFGAILEKRLKSIGIDLKTQPEVNRRLSQIGSRDNSFCTIDLSSASDSLSLSMLKLALPEYVYGILDLIRSPSTLIDGDSVDLNMMSTMGNGFTFPLQTIIFSSVIRSVYRVLDIPLSNSCDNWSCFGDDLIVDKQAYRYVVRLLNLIGCTVNESKSFFEGPIRESCGTDWFFGQPVRGVYIRSLKTKQDILIAINLLNAWTAYTGIPLYYGVQYLISQLRGFIPRVPLDENIDAGIRYPYTLVHKSLPNDRNGSKIYSCYRPIQRFVLVDEASIRCPGRLKKLYFNPPGLYISFLYGELVSYKIATRHSDVRYRTKRLCSPNWDFIGFDSLTNGLKLSRQQWETAVSLNCEKP